MNDLRNKLFDSLMDEESGHENVLTIEEFKQSFDKLLVCVDKTLGYDIRPQLPLSVSNVEVE